MPFEEARRASIKAKECSFYVEALEESRRFREAYGLRKGVIKAEEMPWENSPQGLIKWIVNEKMDTRECCLDIYMQVLPPGGRSGKHAHMAEEVLFILEGRGYDLHWDPLFEVKDRFSWSWAEVPKRFDWEEWDFVYIPPYTAHQHFNADPERPARFLSATNRIVKVIGLGWIEQLENAPDYKP
jgi:quercetin dioxygenase-like cupin family protein